VAPRSAAPPPAFWGFNSVSSEVVRVDFVTRQDYCWFDWSSTN
jgi:hypothetical protein